jgi:hypothetical protein
VTGTEGVITTPELAVACVIYTSFGSCKTALEEPTYLPCIMLLGNLQVHTSLAGGARSGYGPQAKSSMAKFASASILLWRVLCMKLTK